MSRDFSRAAAAVVALALITPPALSVRADELVESAKKVEEKKKTLGAKVDELADTASERKRQALEAADEAKERAREAAEEAKERSRETAESLQERAEEAKQHAIAYAAGLKDELGRRSEQLGVDAKGVVEGAKQRVKDAIQGIRDEAREMLLGAAVALDNRTRDARKAAREAHWKKLKQRYGLADHAPTMEISEELRDHEYRLARLRRARELAEGVRDELSVARCDHLLELEYARHRRRLNRLIDKDRKEHAIGQGEALSYEAEP
jgi:uncharacterized LabA/DUF88 family protein